LEKAESGKCYLRKARDKSLGGVFDGVVLEVGWSSEMVLGNVSRLYRGDPDGWYRLEIRSGKVTGPISKNSLQADSKLSKIRTRRVEDLKF